MRQLASELAARWFGEDGASALRTQYLKAKTRAAPVIRALRGTFDTHSLRAHLSSTVGEDYEVLMVHSSWNGLQPMFDGDALGLVRMLVDWVGPSRTLAMPAFYFGDPSIGGAGKTFEAKPLFDLRRTPSQMGLPSELFRRTPGVVQSRNPVYRVAAFGPLAREIVAGHELSATLCGPGTPFDAMARRNTAILGLGKPIDVLTQVHHAEQVLGDAFPVPGGQTTPLPMTIIDGAERISYLLPRTGLAWRRDMWRLRGIMRPPALREWSFHGAPMFTARAADVSRAVTQAAARGETIYVPPQG